MELPSILFEDESLLAINKPAGMLSIRDGYHPEIPYVASLLTHHYGKLWMVHRLDKDTSGVLVMARSAEAHRSLNDQFEQRQVHKIYHALVSPCPPWKEHTCELALIVDGDRRHRTVISAVGKPARTSFAVLETFKGDTALVEARPFSGYTHQIRAHLLALGFPLVGDSLYRHSSSTQNLDLPIARSALHAYQLECLHPVTAEMLYLEAPYPTDFQAALTALRNSSAG